MYGRRVRDGKFVLKDTEQDQMSLNSALHGHIFLNGFLKEKLIWLLSFRVMTFSILELFYHCTESFLIFSNLDNMIYC